jgi:hypothetical protein
MAINFLNNVSIVEVAASSDTVYADVDRISTTQAAITFATTPTNQIRVLVQKIG